MKEFTFVVKDPLGIHARPAGQLVKVAAGFGDTDVKIVANGKSVDAKRIMGVMQLGVKQGHEVTVTAEGAGEDAAIAAMEKFFQENL